MKKFIYLPLLVSSLLLFSFNVNSVTEPELKEKTKIEFYSSYDANGDQTCYARSCTYSSDPYGNEYKSCTEWEEVPCNAIVPAQ